MALTSPTIPIFAPKMSSLQPNQKLRIMFERVTTRQKISSDDRVNRVIKWKTGSLPVCSLFRDQISFNAIDSQRKIAINF